MSRLEDRLRDTLRERVAAPPAVEALADRAITGATRVRRRRAALASIAAVLSVVLAGAGLGTYLTYSGPAAPSVPAASRDDWLPDEPITELPVDVHIDRYIFEAGGAVISLDSVLPESCEGGSCVSGVWRVSDGFLAAVHDVEAVAGRSVLWHVPDFGAPSVVVDGAGALVVTPGTTRRPGIQVVWADDRRLHLGAYRDRRVTDVVSTAEPKFPIDDRDTQILDPWTVVSDAVVLAAGQNGAETDTWDVWFPDRGDYVPAVYPTIGLHGTTEDRERIIGWYRADPEAPGCLGELKPEEFVPVRSRCPSPFSRNDRVYPSPGGERWAVIGDGEVALYDAESIWDGAAPIQRWSTPGSELDGAWLDAATFVVLQRSTGAVVVVHDIDGGEEAITLPTPGPTAKVSLVTDLR